MSEIWIKNMADARKFVKSDDFVPDTQWYIDTGFPKPEDEDQTPSEKSLELADKIFDFIDAEFIKKFRVVKKDDLDDEPDKDKSNNGKALGKK